MTSRASHKATPLMTHAARSRAAYRRLLRAVDTHITAVGGNATWREAVQHRFRAAAGDRDTALAEEAVRRAEDLAFLVNSVNNHKARASLLHCCFWRELEEHTTKALRAQPA